MDEVLAVRLYSGPSYQPLNTFLRQLAAVRGDYRLHLARAAAVTFTATIAHLCRAVRKLAAVATPAEVSRPLFRGVRGVLPKGFWQEDTHGMVCATDCAFMSTSRNQQTPIDYMGDDDANVLWRLQPQAQSDAGYHVGADISMLSQFAGEEEVLFPPCTLLSVMKQAPGSPRATLRRSPPVQRTASALATDCPHPPPACQAPLAHEAEPTSSGTAPPVPTVGLPAIQSRFAVQSCSAEEKHYLAIDVRPTFV